MRIGLALVAAAAALAAPSPASAQLDEIYNPGFEIPNEFDSSKPDGWGVFNEARRRTMDDGLGPALVRTGDASVEVQGGTGFRAVTTDTLNDEFEYNNLNFEWQGGTVVFSGYYAIPADQPIASDKAGLKAEFRRPEPNHSIYQAFEDLSIEGHTNGQWVYFELVVEDGDFGDFEEKPNRVSLLAMRFTCDDCEPGTGTIFWDDLKYTQGGDCYPDFTGDGKLDLFDFLLFINEFDEGTDRVDCDQNGTLDLFDFLCFVNAFNEGC